MAKKGWIMLKNLRKGAVFQFEDGRKGFNPVGGPTYLLDTGEQCYPPKADKELVREVIVNPLGFFWFGAMYGGMKTRQLSEEDTAKLDGFIKKFIDGIKE